MDFFRASGISLGPQQLVPAFPYMESVFHYNVHTTLLHLLLILNRTHLECCFQFILCHEGAFNTHGRYGSDGDEFCCFTHVLSSESLKAKTALIQLVKIRVYRKVEG